MGHVEMANIKNRGVKQFFKATNLIAICLGPDLPDSKNCSKYYYRKVSKVTSLLFGFRTALFANNRKFYIVCYRKVALYFRTVTFGKRYGNLEI
jgi:hypothetical protein